MANDDLFSGADLSNYHAVQPEDIDDVNEDDEAMISADVEMPEDAEHKEFKFGKPDDPWEGQSTVTVWCEGRQYDPSTEAYHPVYAYKINTPKFEYVGNDIHGGANQVANLDAGAQSLMAFLYACQEGMPQKVSEENGDLFPKQVREWAYHYAEDIGMVSVQLQAEYEG